LMFNFINAITTWFATTRRQRWTVRRCARGQ
jgi:hypothetical protein